MRYAIVAGPELLTDQALAAARRRRALLRDPTTSPAAIQAAVARTQAVAWVVAGVHGSERSGTNAVLRVLYDLATGTEAPASQLLRAAVVVVVPVQNPDGHHAGVRFNSAGFDLNRDWFAATQPETAGLLGLVRQYPPQLLLDLHEKNGTGYFVPPYTDPIHHEVPASVLAWTEQRYGAAIAERFRADGVDFVTGREFDLFYPGHSDTACALSTLAPGLTLEKGQASPFSDRVRQHTSASWAALSTLAAGGRDALWEWHLAHREAYQQGLRGVLAPGVRPGAPVDRRLVRHYFLPPQRGRSAERDLVVRRLLLAGVQVHRLTRQLSVPDLRPYGRPAAPAVLPKGTYWIPTAQAGKHWVQAMLGESSYPSGGVFFDTTAWSLPLLANIAGGSSGAELTPAAEPVTSVRAPRPPARAVRPPRLPRLAVLHTMPPTLPVFDSLAWLTHRLDHQWRLPYRLLRPAQVTSEELATVDVLLVPDGPPDYLPRELDQTRLAALRSWTATGGRYVGWCAGAQLAVLAGLTTAEVTEADAEIPGALIRVEADPRSPLTAGVGPTVWQLNWNDLMLRPTDPAHTVLRYPAADSAAWFVSGFHLGAETLAGTAALTDQPLGTGRVTLFAGEPDFRAMAEGTAQLLRNAILVERPGPAQDRSGPPPWPSPAARARPGPRGGLRLTVRAQDTAVTEAVLRSAGSDWRRLPATGWARFQVNAPANHSCDQRSWATGLLSALRGRGVRPVATSLR